MDDIEKTPGIGNFLVPLLILLPVAYLVWYRFADVFALPAALLSGALSHWLFADVVHRVVKYGVSLVFLVDGDPAGTARQFLVYLPPLGSGLPLFIALSLASDARFIRHVINLFSGWLLLVMGQTVSVMFKVGATLFSYSPPITSPDALCSTDCYWAMLYYVQYFTYMLLPNLLPVIVWALLYRQYVRELVAHIARKSIA
jgi:hypothetical protein